MRRMILGFLISAACISMSSGRANAQAAVFDLPEKFLDSNGVNISGGSLDVAIPLVGFGDQVRMRASYSQDYPLTHAVAPFDFIERGGFFSGCGGGEYGGGWTPLGQTLYRCVSSLEIIMPNGWAYKRPAGGRFLVPIYSAHYTTPGRTLIGFYDDRGNQWKPGLTSTSSLETQRVTYADGEVWDIKYQKAFSDKRLRSVISNRGYIIQYEYERELSPTITSQLSSWKRPVKISGGSLAHNYCDTSGTSLCGAISNAGNSALVSYFTTGFEVTHTSGFKRRLEFPAAGELLVSAPGTNSQLLATYGPEDCVYLGQYNQDIHIITGITKDGQSWNYSFDWCEVGDRGVVWRMKRTDPAGQAIFMEQDSYVSIPSWYKDENGLISYFGGTPELGYVSYQYPEGNDVSIGRDLRNNPASVAVYGKNGGTITKTATFDSVCANLITCNQPNTETDANGNTTTFIYDSVHGGLLTRTGPAVNGVTPQTRYEYAQRYAWLKNSSGGYSQGSSPIWVLVRERFCRTTSPSGSGCVGGTSDEVVTDYDYGPNTGPNNLLLRGVAVTADGQTRRTCYGYDQMGRKISETKPSALLTVCP
jgi:hypothetical protein